MANLWWIKALLWRSKTKSLPLTLKNYLAAITPVINQRFIDAPLMAIDLEMTGLDPLNDQVISIGIVPIVQGVIPLDKAQHVMIAISGSVGQSATVHGIVDNQLHKALSIEQAMQWFLAQTQGHILVAHHAPLDIQFIQQQLQRCFGQSIPLVFIDTLAIEKKRCLRQQDVLRQGTLRLGASRERYHLPVYSAHNALVDALSCGELLLAQVAAMGNINNLKLKDLIEIA
ncbi:DNA polymerase III subunit epsilon [Shewanella inventionis]|uniref:DNA polymerase III subunit epsilon n=1 Tax=Shewanella inventionis TaxID=1738770 RepID=A0ABQ1IUV8_9GAMM|nr:exonuclease domain-containing protein [Shewanella inventionis]MCL1160169.1 3'-5' exonuclease [Shewanella inventionis]GGB51710.1 DNA polymerase III subunit epsilon [Shewanella inventionis]